eukprot:CAMPEP_0202769204 /NCGR_PEP_ID=MMETSP1388-20130828/36210_1 /ASSEMBLY_ACC=CAM_ASM_000864 /TAXON_ID=37098 /ORGANISM="Isochrysis sp, Strain CCMP1244" /LENGTH=65 /DNA_ID=CAMNT_0049437977 /DNA_START=28 /DNA_END=222 /DNA_ORIENTATION=+
MTPAVQYDSCSPTATQTARRAEEPWGREAAGRGACIARPQPCTALYAAVSVRLTARPDVGLCRVV